MAELISNAYGKARVRLSKVTRLADHHLFQEMTVDVVLSGAFDKAYTAGDNSMVLPTDTIKNTVYVLAKSHDLGSPESFGLALGEHYLAHAPAAEQVEISIEERRWKRMVFEGATHPHAFIGASGEVRTAEIQATKESVSLTGGLANLPILKTTGSAFVGFLKDEYTILPEETDRIMATNLEAQWQFDSVDADFNGAFDGVRSTLLSTFATHQSESVQHTLYAMGEAALSVSNDISEIRLVMPNVHNFPFDLGRFGIENNKEIFYPADEPHGYIDGIVRR